MRRRVLVAVTLAVLAGLLVLQACGSFGGSDVSDSGPPDSGGGSVPDATTSGIDSGAQDAGTIAPADAAHDGPDGSPAIVGCSDGTREGFLPVDFYP